MKKTLAGILAFPWPGATLALLLQEHLGRFWAVREEFAASIETSLEQTGPGKHTEFRKEA